MVARKIRNKWHIDFRVEGKRYRLPSPVNTRKGAIEYERVVRTRILYGEPVDGKPASPTLAEFAPRYLDLYVATHCKPSTLKARRQKIGRYLLPTLGQYRLNEIDVKHCDKLIADLYKKGLSSGTVAATVEALRAMLGVAVDWGECKEVPKLRRVKTKPPPPKFLSREDAATLLEHIPQEFWLLFFCALRTGLRKGELRALRWTDIDFDRSVITVSRTMFERVAELSAKSGKSRQVPMSPEVLAAMKAGRHLKGPHVFCDSSGQPLTEIRPNQILKRACTSAGIEQITFHQLRHTFASHLVLAGVSLRVIQELLGHGSITTTMIYAHLQENQTKEAVKILDKPQILDIMGTIWS